MYTKLMHLMYQMRKIGVVFGIAFVTTVVVLLTPLRWTPLLEPRIDDVDPAEFYEEYRANPEQYIFIDVRPENAFRALHAAGSINMPLHTLYDERKLLPRRGKDIVLICSGGRASGVGYHYLEHFGFRNIRRVEGGIENWVLKKLPTEGAQMRAE